MKQKNRYTLREKTTDDARRFFYLDMGSETHGRISFRIWIAGTLVLYDEQRKEYFIEFPLPGAEIIRTEKGTLVLRPREGFIVYDVFVPPGYRGEGKFKILAPPEARAFYYARFKSPRGSCGIGTGALVVAPQGQLVVRWERTGRLYGDAPEGITVYYPNGEVTELEYIPDGLEELQAIEDLLNS